MTMLFNVDRARKGMAENKGSKMSARIISENDAKDSRELGGLVREYVMGEHLHFLIGYFKPGEGLREHCHVQPEEVYYVLKGKGKALMENKWVDVREGTVIYIPPGVVHTVKNVGNEELQVVFFLSPPEKGTLKVVE
jgi:mannose-6-phosphate isomerase-like protein (cupin superfamily)